jgi:signal transduction histidine kinase
MRAALADFFGLDDLWERPAPSSRLLRVPVVGWLSAVDLVVAGAAVLGAALAVWLQGAIVGIDGAWWRQGVSIVVLGLILCFRRRFPMTQGALSAAHLLIGAYLAPGVSNNFFVQVFYFVSMHATVAWGRSRRAAWGVIAAIELVLMGWVAVIFARTNSLAQIMKALAPQAQGPQAVVRIVVFYALINSAFVLGAGALGQVSWREARALARARDQAETIAAQESRLAEQAVVAERLRIAREIHDSVAHHVSVIGIQAAGARRAMDAAPDLAREALSAVEEESRLAVSEMRSLLGSLRQDAGAGPGLADPGLGDLPELCAQLHGAHSHAARISLDVVGPANEVGGALGLTVYRIVQEALNNVEKHSGASHAHVAVRIGSGRIDSGRIGGGQLEVEVTDDGRGARALPDPGGTRVGLIGMRERVGAHGGTLETGPRVTGGWRVLARMPLHPGAQNGLRDAVEETR